MRQARAYYSRAVDLTQGQSARGLFGIMACSAAITDKVCALSFTTSWALALIRPGGCAHPLMAHMHYVYLRAHSSCITSAWLALMWCCDLLTTENQRLLFSCSFSQCCTAR